MDVTALGLRPGGTAAAAPAAAGTLQLSEAEWKARLTAAQYRVLRQAGTEPAGSSPNLNDEKRRGSYHCAGCEQPLFTSEAKYEQRHRLAELPHRPCPAPVGTMTGLTR